MSDVHSAAAAYAVDAMSSAERAEFEVHLDDCTRCRSEVSEFAETLADLASLVATEPPATLRDLVMAEVADLRQAGPQRAARTAERTGRAGDQGSDEVAPRRALASVTELRPLEPHEVAPLEEHPSVVPEMPWLGVAAALSEDMGRPSRWRERVLGGLLAAALVAAVALGGWVYVSRQQIQTQTTQAQQVTELLTAPDAEIYDGRVSGSPVSFVVSEQRNQVLFIGRDLPEPEGHSIYQLWTLKGDVPTSAGVVDEGGDVRQWLDGSVEDIDGLAVTIEPGPLESKTPTQPIYRANPPR